MCSGIYWYKVFMLGEIENNYIFDLIFFTDLSSKFSDSYFVVSGMTHHYSSEGFPHSDW